eukprot:scaffold127401_cov21-Phaeocystis_antarctica.AAC.1
MESAYERVQHSVGTHHRPSGSKRMSSLVRRWAAQLGGAGGGGSGGGGCCCCGGGSDGDGGSGGSGSGAGSGGGGSGAGHLSRPSWTPLHAEPEITKKRKRGGLRPHSTHVSASGRLGSQPR